MLSKRLLLAGWPALLLSAARILAGAASAGPPGAEVRLAADPATPQEVPKALARDVDVRTAYEAWKRSIRL